MAELIYLVADEPLYSRAKEFVVRHGMDGIAAIQMQLDIVKLFEEVRATAVEESEELQALEDEISDLEDKIEALKMEQDEVGYDKDELKELKTLIEKGVSILNEAYENFTIVEENTRCYDPQEHSTEDIEEAHKEGLKQLLKACEILETDPRYF